MLLADEVEALGINQMICEEKENEKVFDQSVGHERLSSHNMWSKVNTIISSPFHVRKPITHPTYLHKRAWVDLNKSKDQGITRLKEELHLLHKTKTTDSKAEFRLIYIEAIQAHHTDLAFGANTRGTAALKMPCAWFCMLFDWKGQQGIPFKIKY